MSKEVCVSEQKFYPVIFSQKAPQQVWSAVDYRPWAEVFY